MKWTKIRYAAKGAQGSQGIQGIQGAKGISGAKPSIWYRGYEYKWDDEKNEYVRWVRKGNGPAKPFTLKEAVGNDVKKYADIIAKSKKTVAKPKATKTKAPAKPKTAKKNVETKEEPPKVIDRESSFDTLKYKGFTADAKDLERYKEELKSLKDDELTTEEAEVGKYGAEYRKTNHLGYLDEGFHEVGAFCSAFKQAIQDERERRKAQNVDKIEYPTFNYKGLSTIDEYKERLAKLPSESDLIMEMSHIYGYGNTLRYDWGSKYSSLLSSQDFKKYSEECKNKVGDIVTEMLGAVREEQERRREEAAKKREEETQKRREELERRKAQRISETPKNKVDSYRPDISHFPEKISETRELNIRLGGSTGAKMVEDAQGNRYIKKTGNSADHIVNESCADAFYQAAGVKVPGFKLYDDGSGNPVKLATVIDDAQSLGDWWDDASDEERDEMRKKLRRGLAADVLLGNWDVVGMDADNILIDKNGEAWRIDNGGSMKFRAQGGIKNQANWGDYIDDLFTMTGNGEVVGRSGSSTITDYFGTVRPLELAQEINSLDWSDSLKTLPDDERRVVENRLEEIRQIAERGEDNEKYGRSKESTDRIIAFSYQLTRDGIRDALPKSVDLTIGNLADWKKESGWLSSGNTTATLGGKDYDSLGEYLADKMGKENFNAVQNFNEHQAEGSYEEISVYRKLCILKAYGIDCLKYSNVEDFLKDVEEAGYYCAYNRDAADEQRKAFIGAFEHYQQNPDEFKKHCEATEQFDAAIQMILENVQMENVDPVTRTVVLGRTENKTHFRNAPDSSETPNDVERTYHHTGVCESHSRVQYGCVSGYGLTVVRVPFSRIHGLWMMERGYVGPNGYSPEDHVMFCDDSENEIIADTHGLTIIFMKDLEPEHGYGSGKQKHWDATPFIDKFLQWEKDHPDQVATVLTGVKNND